MGDSSFIIFFIKQHIYKVNLFEDKTKVSIRT